MTSIKDVLVKNISFQSQWLDRKTADQVYAELMQLPWQHEFIQMFGKLVRVPRKVIWVGDPGSVYTYSKLSHDPIPWPPCLDKLRTLLVKECRYEFNSALLNLYKSGHDYMGWHSDNEPELGSHPCLASVSFGAGRRFLLKSKANSLKYEYMLEHGSLLVMKGSTQELFKHSLPKMLKVKEMRINVTFRKVKIS